MMPRTATPTSADTTVREEVGIQFPAGSDGTRPTTPTVKAIVAEAVRNSDPALASRVEADTSWRQGYVGAMRELTVRTAADDDAATTIAATASPRRAPISSTLPTTARRHRSPTSTSTPPSMPPAARSAPTPWTAPPSLVRNSPSPTRGAC